MKTAVIPILLLLTSCASSRKESLKESVQTSADSLSSHHVQAIRHRTDSAATHSIITIDSLTITPDSIPQLRAYGVRIKRKSKLASAETASQTCDSVSHVRGTLTAFAASEHTETPSASPLLRRIAAIAIAAALITAIFKLIRL